MSVVVLGLVRIVHRGKIVLSDIRWCSSVCWSIQSPLVWVFVFWCLVRLVLFSWGGLETSIPLSLRGSLFIEKGFCLGTHHHIDMHALRLGLSLKFLPFVCFQSILWASSIGLHCTKILCFVRARIVSFLMSTLVSENFLASSWDTTQFARVRVQNDMSILLSNHRNRASNSTTGPDTAFWSDCTCVLSHLSEKYLQWTSSKFCWLAASERCWEQAQKQLHEAGNAQQRSNAGGEARHGWACNFTNGRCQTW